MLTKLTSWGGQNWTPMGGQNSKPIDKQFKIGENATRESLREGDLVFFGDSESQINLVGIYLGNGRLVHAGTREGDSVKIANLDEPYFANYFVGARRYF